MAEIDASEEDKPFWIIDMKTYIISLFDKSIDSMHKFITKKVKEPIPTVPVQLAKSLINLLEIFCSV